MSEPDAGAPRRERRKIVGIDPGRTKCGFAVVYDDGERACAEVVLTAEIAERIEREVRAGGVMALCVGDATSSAAIAALCMQRWPNIKTVVVDETNTTLEARKLYYEDNPPRGLWRFVPRGLLVPPGPIDGYAAVLIARRYRHNPREGKAEKREKD